MRRFSISFSIFLFLWLPMVVVSLPIIFILLLTRWDGKTTWFGNYLYGRKGNMHMPINPTLFDEWNFLAIRNPISNFGKFTLSRGPEDTAWLVDAIWWRIGILYGWEYSDPRLPGGLIIQWGQGTPIAGGELYSLPIAFPTMFAVAICSSIGQAEAVNAVAELTSLTQVRLEASSASTVINYIALGY